MRVDAVNPATGKRNSVRVDGEVLGNERISSPAGTFDTVKVRRYVYAGDWDGFMRETHITEIDWYAPALGRPVRTESKSQWQDMSRCTREGCPWFRGDWDIVELLALNPAPPSGLITQCHRCYNRFPANSRQEKTILNTP